MVRRILFYSLSFILLSGQACRQTALRADQNDNDSTLHPSPSTALVESSGVINPAIITEQVQFDTDDPAIWIDSVAPENSLIVGTDKDENGGLYVFDLKGKILRSKTVTGLKRPDNVDVEYGLKINGKSYDIAVTTERMTHKLRIFSLPDLKPLDGGGIEVFSGETAPAFRDLMGIALYKNKESNEIFAIVGRKNGPTDGSYLWQYQLQPNSRGLIEATLVRKFGKYSGVKEIEAIAVDDELGYVYYSDEGVGVRKYYADPKKGNNELALFGTMGFAQDHEGISIYKINNGTGYILVSDQQANQFFVYPREGSNADPNDHQLIKVVKVSAQESDGSEVTSNALNDEFGKGLFVVMSTDKTFHYYRWEDIAGKELKIVPNGNQVKNQ